jgi:hypothetical protein
MNLRSPDSITRWLVLVVVFLTSPMPLRAGVPVTLARELAETLVRRTQGTVATATENLVRRAARAAVAQGDEAAALVRGLGPRAVELVENEAVQHSPEAAQRLARQGATARWIVARQRSLALVREHGDGVAVALAKHRAVGEALIERCGAGAVPVLNRLSPRSGRRLALLAHEGFLARSGRAPEVLQVIRRHGDRAMDFLWRHRFVLGGSAVLAAFLAHPEPYLDGTAHLADSVLGATARPVAEGVGRAAASAVHATALIAGAITIALLAPPLVVLVTRLRRGLSARAR